MCTVSFIRTKSNVIISSNRDEHRSRALAVEPKKYSIQGNEVIFPKDPKAGGTWFGIVNKNTVIVLLNGADERHHSNPPYSKSRGIIMLELFAVKNPRDFWNNIILDNIEPFTIVLFQDNQLFQLRWNGNKKTTTMLNAYQNYIWSSSTLYEKKIREERQMWFDDFLAQNNQLFSSNIYDFHQKTKKEDLENGLCINRESGIRTVSITQCDLESDKLTILHHDLVRSKKHQISEYF